MSYDPGRVFRKLARNNRLANVRLHASCLRLSQHEFTAPRTSFFPTIRATLNHIYLVDLCYIDAMQGGTIGLAAFHKDEPFEDMASLRDAQAQMDDRLIALVDRLTTVELAQTVFVQRGERVQTDRCDDILTHLFQHQTHHRGQVHSMLSGTGVSPPQLDEFVVGDDAGVRQTEMKALGWTEADLMNQESMHD
ncbi:MULTISPECIES: DinB family protein [unclassified Rhizobium]|uniref:DinB family protein n=1 Tax=unclassified Rhizobium TaxID=2613769 RepID=UPI00177EC39F|nr:MULTISPECIES: DinB family protein [unclassified Rhizobium]MBD8686537.1 damage-inducible protein DinB [Rhizobium sp. CFBP 13644]MBD8691662.1 damage-inducible protein DinB [Rhizobium sp. CFBP 13717]